MPGDRDRTEDIWPLGEPDNLPPPPESMRAMARRLVRLIERIRDLPMKVSLLVDTFQKVTYEEGATLIAELLRETDSTPSGKALRIALAISLGEGSSLPERFRAGILQEARSRGDESVANLLAPRGAYRSLAKDDLPPPPPGSPTRELSLGERRALARRPNRNTLERLMVDPEPLVIRNLLRNPRLTEADVLRLASRRPCPSAVLAEIYASQRWICRRRVQLALVLNPYNRTDISLRLLETLGMEDLKTVAKEGTVDPVVRRAAQAALEG